MEDVRILKRVAHFIALSFFLAALALPAFAQEMIVHEKPVHLNRIAGIVVDANGSPVSGARIELRSVADNATLYSTTSGSQGKFSFARGITHSPVRVWIYHDLFKPVQYTIVLQWFAPGRLTIVLSVAT